MHISMIASATNLHFECQISDNETWESRESKNETEIEAQARTAPNTIITIDQSTFWQALYVLLNSHFNGLLKLCKESVLYRHHPNCSILDFAHESNIQHTERERESKRNDTQIQI